MNRTPYDDIAEASINAAPTDVVLPPSSSELSPILKAADAHIPGDRSA
jgi:hypothetical protein